MAHCPKCDQKLRIIDWRPECPHCGANVFCYDFEKQFYIDAKGAEMDAAKIRVKWARVKAALIGGKIPVSRLCLCLLPLITTLVTFGKIHISFPLFEKSISLNIIGLFSVFTDGTFGYFSALKNSAIAGAYAGNTLTILFSLASAAVLAFLIFIFQLLCFISAKKMAIISSITAVLGTAAAVFSMIAVHMLTKSPFGEILTAENGFGGFALAAAFLVPLVLNLIVAIKGIRVRYVEGDLYRVEVAKKLKRHEITLDEIPQPVYSPEPQNEQPQKELSEVGGSSANG